MTRMIEAQGLGKEYRLGGVRSHPNTLYERLASLTQRSTWARQTDRRFWALRGVDFNVEASEVVGVIGRNGAGKSTLLKILSRITDPTVGRVLLRGRVASLLEVGTGFHPELSGRENIRLNGALLGMSRAEVARRFDEIVAFSEIEEFLDTPVKRYSSGMYVRLAFAVAAHLEPDILLVDEVLAVGDVAFQNRCLGRMQEVAGEGRTVLFVSHNMAAVSRLCARAIHLDGGRVAADGPVQSVVEGYLRQAAEAPGEWRAGAAGGAQAPRWLRSARLLDDAGEVSAVADFDRGFTIEIEFVAPGRDEEFVLAFRLVDSIGVDVFSSWDSDSQTVRSTEPGAIHRARCRVPPRLVRPGTYTVMPLLEIVKAGARHALESGSFTIQVSEVGFGRFASRWGVVTPYLEWLTVQDARDGGRE